MKRQKEGFFRLLRGASCHSETNSDLRKSWFLMQQILSGHTWFSGSQNLWSCSQSYWKIVRFRYISNTKALPLDVQPVSSKGEPYTSRSISRLLCLTAQLAVALVAFSTPRQRAGVCRHVKWEQLPALDRVKLQLTHRDKYPNTLNALLSSLLSFPFCSFASFKVCTYKDSCAFKLQNKWVPKQFSADQCKQQIIILLVQAGGPRIRAVSPFPVHTWVNIQPALKLTKSLLRVEVSVVGITQPNYINHNPKHVSIAHSEDFLYFMKNKE